MLDESHEDPEVPPDLLTLYEVLEWDAAVEAGLDATVMARIARGLEDEETVEVDRS